jgi:hypothetical protein
MNFKKLIAGVASLTVLAGGLIAPNAALAQTPRQKDKNNMRNLGLGLGAAAAYEAINKRGTHALVLGAGAVYAGKKYEDARKAQKKDNRVTRRYVYQKGKRVGYYKMQNGRRIGYVRFRNS